MNKLLITGGVGFLGTNIALYAINKGYKVITFDSLIRNRTEKNAQMLQEKGVELVRGDVRNKDDLERIPKVDAIIHLASNPGIRMSIKYPEFDFMVNALGTVNILEFARKHGNIPVIYASTNKVYSEEINDIPLKEGKKKYSWDIAKLKKSKIRSAVKHGVSKKGIKEIFPVDSHGKYPHTPYGASKYTGDLYCQEYFHVFEVPTVVNRMSCIYGLYQKGVEDQGWLDWFIRAKVNNRKLNIYGNGKQVRDALFGEDAAELYIKQLENIDKVKGQVFNLGGGHKNTVSLIEVIEHLNTKPGKNLKLDYKDWREADQRIYISDISKVSKMLNWKPKVDPFEGIDRIYEQYQKNS